MSRYEKARELVDFILDLAARRHGMSMREIADRFSGDNLKSRQTSARRLVNEVETLFPTALERPARPGDGAVSLDAVAVGQLPAATPGDRVALSLGAKLLRQHGDETSAAALDRLANALAARLRISGDRLREADVEAMLEGRHLVARPGPRATMRPEIGGPLSDALLALKRVAFDYTRGEDVLRRTVEPWGLITSGRTYLVARLAGLTWGEPTRFRLDRMSNVTVLDEGYAIPDDFDLAAYARLAFGAYYRPEEYGEVVWKFAPKAADDAASFDFHPDQTTETTPDGSLIVRFRAAGHLEMAWFLYQWGDAVEVLEPPALRELIAGHRRGDFMALP